MIYKITNQNLPGNRRIKKIFGILRDNSKLPSDRRASAADPSQSIFVSGLSFGYRSTCTSARDSCSSTGMARAEKLEIVKCTKGLRAEK